jgi:hypothetical protein
LAPGARTVFPRSPFRTEPASSHAPLSARAGGATLDLDDSALKTLLHQESPINRRYWRAIRLQVPTVKVHQIELLGELGDLLEQSYFVGKGFRHRPILSERTRRTDHQPGRSSRVLAGEQSHLVTLAHQLLGEIGDDSLGPPVLVGRDTLEERRDLCNAQRSLWRAICEAVESQAPLPPTPSARQAGPGPLAEGSDSHGSACSTCVKLTWEKSRSASGPRRSERSAQSTESSCFERKSGASPSGDSKCRPLAAAAWMTTEAPDPAGSPYPSK